MATMNENKGKDIAGDEIVQPRNAAPTQTRPPASSTLKLIPPTSSKKRKTMSKKLDMGNLPSRKGNKKQKVDSSMLPTTLVMVLDLAASMAKTTTSKVEDSLPCSGADLSDPVGPLNSGPMTLPRSEGLAWDRFKQVVTDKDIAIYYDMFVKEFERSTVHDLFKVF